MDTTFLRFRADQKSPFIEVHQGEYRRRFEGKDQPFEITDADELRMLRETGLFVEDKQAEQESRELDVELAPAKKKAKAKE